MADPLSLRYNNPGAVEFQPWMGAYGGTLGPNGRYAQFPSLDAGYGAMSRILDTYQTKHGLNTVSGIVNRWAPSDVDNNNTSGYVNFVARNIGADPNAPLTPEQRQKLPQAMASFESGRNMMGVPMALGGPQASASPQPMPTSQSMDATDQPSVNLFDRIGTTMQSPLFMMGAGVMSAPTIGQGLISGAQAAQLGAMAQLAQQKARRDIQQQNQRDQMWRELFSSGNVDQMLKGYPGLTKEALYALGPDAGAQLLGKIATGRGDLQFQLDAAKQLAQQKQDLDLELQRKKLGMAQQLFGMGGAPQMPQPSSVPGTVVSPPAGGAPPSAAPQPQPPAQGAPSVPMGGAPQFDPRQLAAYEAAGVLPAGAGKVIMDDPNYQIEQRRRAAVGMNLDPNSPVGREYILTGKYPAVEKNYPAIQKADEAVTQADNSLDTAHEASRLNKSAYDAKDWFPGLRTTVGSWFGDDKATDTQNYQAAAKVLSQEIAKSLSGGRVTQFEQKLMSDLQGGLSQTREARAAILDRATKHLESVRAMRAKQAEDLRNGTYYNPGNAPAASSSGGWSIEEAR